MILLNVRAKTMEILEENMGKIFVTLGKQRFLRNDKQ